MELSAERIKSIFNQALEIDSSQDRQAFLDRECAGEPEMRSRVEGLLSAYAVAGSFLEPSQAGMAATVSLPARDAPGTMVGHYKLLQQIGEGGMGVVYLAEQLEPVRRKVALKIIKPGLDTEQVIVRFEAERQAVAMMDHPNIAKVLDAGTTPTGRPYFVMELVKGIPITKYCDQEHLNPRERLDLYIPVCHAVQHAHQKGVIHRDLKPSNVLVALYDGLPVPKVIDFGVAKATDQKLTNRTMFTEVGSIVGTLEYMAPEQAELNNLDIDTRADIYSLGVILYELLTGSPPFSSKQLRSAAFVEVLRMLREVEPPKPSTKVSTADDLPSIAAARRLEPKRLKKLMHGELDWIVMKCLEKERARRYETASALAADIHGYLHEEPVAAGPPSTTYRLKKLVWKNKGPVVAVTLIMLALVGGIVGTSVGLVRAMEAESKAKKRADAEAVAKRDAIRARREESRALKEKARALDQETKSKQQEQEQRKLAEEALVEKENALLRSEGLRLSAEAATARFRDPTLALLLSLKAVEKAPNHLTFATLYAAWADCRELRMLGGHTGLVNIARYSPDGQLIVSAGNPDPHYGNDENVPYASARVWDAKTGELRATWHGYNLPISSLDWSPDGRFIAATLEENQRVRYSDDLQPKQHVFTDRVVYLWDPLTGKDVVHLRRHDDRVVSVQFSSDSSKVLTSSWDKTARIWETQSGKLLHTLSGHERALYTARFTPDGKRVVTITSNSNLAGVSDSYYKSLQDEDGNPLVIDPGVQNRPMKFEGDVGRSTGSTSLGSESPLARIWDVDTGQQVGFLTRALWLRNISLAKHPGAVAVSLDSQRIAIGFDDGATGVWDLATGGNERFLLTGHDQLVVAAAFSPNGNRIATASADDSARLWDGTSGRQLLQLRGINSLVSSLEFSNDSKQLLTADENSARLWDVATGEERGACRGHTSTVHEAHFSPDQKTIVTADDFTVRIWSAEASSTPSIKLAGHEKPLRAMSYSPDGQQLLTASEDETARLWNTMNGQQIRAFGVDIDLGIVQTASFSPRGAQVLTASAVSYATKFGKVVNSSAVHCWDVQTGNERLSLVDHETGAAYAAFSPNETSILTISDGTKLHRAKGLIQRQFSNIGSAPADMLRLWSAQTGQLIVQIPTMSWLMMPRYRPDGSQVLAVTAGPNTVTIYDTFTGEVAHTLQTNNVFWSYADYTPDNRFIVSAGSDNQKPIISVWDANTGQLLASLDDVKGAVHALYFSADGRRMAGTYDRNVQLWDLTTRKSERILTGHEAQIIAAAFSRKGDRLLTGSDDSTAVLWDLSTGKIQSIYRGHPGPVRFVAFHPQGLQVATASTDNVAHLWPTDLLPVIQARLSRGLTPAERERYEVTD